LDEVGDDVGAVKKPAKPPTTKAGRALSAKDERRLAEEAEAGFDPAGLLIRGAGRPSVSGRRGASHRVDLRVDDETYTAIRELADRDERKVSDVVREAIRHYLDAG
jgi:hypothetical protein